MTTQNSCTHAIKNKPGKNKADYIKYISDHYINSYMHSVMKKIPTPSDQFLFTFYTHTKTHIKKTLYTQKYEHLEKSQTSVETI